MPEMALRFILNNQDVSTIIPGMRKRRHVDANLAASDQGPLPPSSTPNCASTAGTAPRRSGASDNFILRKTIAHFEPSKTSVSGRVACAEKSLRFVHGNSGLGWWWGNASPRGKMANRNKDAMSSGRS